jgi:DNA polymerase III delta prime subunit
MKEIKTNNDLDIFNAGEYKLPEQNNNVIDVTSYTVKDVKEVSYLDQIKFSCEKYGIKINKEPKKNCKKCLEKGYVGIDSEKLPIACSCLFPKKTEKTETTDKKQNMIPLSFLTREQKRKEQRFRDKKLKKQMNKKDVREAFDKIKEMAIDKIIKEAELKREMEASSPKTEQGKSINDIVLPASLKSFFKKIVKEKDLPNLLLVSSCPGTGKSSVARALCNELDAETLHINTSKTGIDVLRTDIEKFAHCKSLTGTQKVVILEEFCGTNRHFQEALRADIEQYLSCRFILTANYITKIIEPIRSRMQEINFNFMDGKTKTEMIPKIIKRLQIILKFQNVEYSEETLEKLVNSYYPDIRKMIMLLQQYYNTYGIINNNIFSYDTMDDEFYDFILKKQLTKARKYLLDKNFNHDEIYKKLFDNFIPKLPKEIQGQAIIVLGEFSYRTAFCVDKEICATACLLELMSLL